MRSFTRRPSTSHRFLASLLAILVVTIGFSFGAGVGTANAAGCHIFNASTAFDADFISGTPRYTVPSWSTCHDINISSISDVANPNDICAEFFVRFFPSSGGFYDGPPKIICSAGAWYVLASNVANGTKYEINWYANQHGQHYNFKIMD